MILPNIHKFEYDSNYHINMRQLSTLIVCDNVLLCPQTNSLYTWWLPKTSPTHEHGGWAKLKHISTCENKNVSLWDRKKNSSGNTYYHDDIREIVTNKMDIYLVKMKDIGYTFRNEDGHNFDIYITSEEIIYSTNLTNDKSNDLMVTSAKSIMHPIYHLETNEYMYSMNEWSHLDDLPEWTANFSDELHTTQTPKPSCQRNLMEEYGSNSENEEDSEEESEADYGEGWKNGEVLKNSEEESGGPNLIYEDDEIEEEDELIPFYKPWSQLTHRQINSAYALGYTEDTWEDQHPFQVDNNDLMEWSHYSRFSGIGRDHLWVTSGEFWNHLMILGMDEDRWNHYVSENKGENETTIAEGIPVDSSVMEQDYEEKEEATIYRMDYSDGNWYTKDEFMEYYGSNYVWKMMSPKKYIMREVLYYAYFTAARLPKSLRKAFIEDYTTTYY